MKRLCTLILALIGILSIIPGSQAEGKVILTISGAVPFELEQAFMKAKPGVMLQIIDEVNEEELARRLTTQDDTIDIFCLPMDMTCWQLLQKGMAASLECSEAILSDVKAMDENIQTVLTDGSGDIAAYPVRMEFWYTAVNEGYWHMLFGNKPLPETFDEVLDAWIEWESEYAEQYPGLGFIDWDFDYPNEVKGIIQAYLRQHDGESLPDVTTPELRSALEKLRKVYELRVEAHRTVTGEADPLLEQFSGETGPGKVFQMSLSDAITRDDLSLEVTNSQEYLYGIPKGDLTYLPIRFDSEITHHTDARLYVFIVNPYSKQMETAIHFIGLLTDRTVMPDSWYSMHPQADEPLENPCFSKTLEQYIAEKDDCERAIEQAEEYGLDSTSIRSHLDYYNAWLENQDSMRWVISEKTITDYRAKIETYPIIFHERSPFLCQDGSMTGDMLYEMCSRYAEGSISLDELLGELNKKMNMIYLENQ